MNLAIRASILALMTSVSFAAHAVAEGAKTMDIPAGSLKGALEALARQSGTPLVYRPEQVEGLTTRGVQGELSAQEAALRLLEGTPLKVSVNAKGAMLIAAPMVREKPTASLGHATGLASQGADESGSKPATVDDLQEVVVEASKLGSTVVRTPQSISVLSGTDLETRGVQDFMEAMRYVPGASPEIYGYEGKGYEWIILRGFDASYTGNYRDGLNQSLGWFAIPYTEPYNVERVEILRGPSSVLFGQADAGGIINRISKRPDAGARSEFMAEVGNFERKKIGLDFGGALNGDETLRYRLVSTALDSGSQRQYSNGDDSRNTTVFVAPSLLWRMSDDTSITLLTDYRKARLKGYSFYRTSPDGSFNGVLIGDPDFILYDQMQASAGYRFEHGFNESWVLRQNFRYSYLTAEVDDIYARFPFWEADGHTLLRRTIKSDDWLAQTLVDTHLQGDFQMGGVQQTVMLGVDVNRQHWDLKYYGGDAPSLDILNPVYGQPIAEATVLSLDMATSTRLTGVYAQYRAELTDALSVTLGSRYDRATVTTEDDAAQLVTRQKDDAFTARAGMSYALANGLTPYLSYSESFLPQGGADVNGTPFEPTRGDQLEAGVKYQPAGIRGFFTVALFDITKTNVVTADPDNYGYSYTKGELQSRGIELEGRFEMAAGVGVAASYTRLDVEVTRSNDGDQGKTPIQIPDQMANLWVDYSRFSGGLSGLTVSGGLRHVGERFDDSLNTLSSESYTLVDFGTRYERGPWLYAVNVVNAFDKQYIQSRAFGGYSLGYDRTVTASVRYRW
jgi:iron complex outermembrane receptor protein